MKKILFILLISSLATLLMADFNFYGNARIGMWYQMLDEDYTGGEARFELQNNIYTNSRFGANYSAENFKAVVEFGYKPANAVYLRLLYGQYSFRDFDLLIGQAYTGFSDFSNQATSIYSGLDDGLIGYGAYFDGRRPMLKFSFMKGAYAIIMEPSRSVPFLTAGAVDALIPKINIGYAYQSGNIKFHPTFGLNVVNYNPDFATWTVDNPDYDPEDPASEPYLTMSTDVSVISYALAATVRYKEGDLDFTVQVNAGQNIGNYGLASSSASMAGWNVEKDEVIDIMSVGGYAELGYKVGEKTCLRFGAGYQQSKSDEMKDQDTGMSGYFQAAYKLNGYITLVPEIGLYDNMEDGYGKVEGSMVYAGTKVQVDFK